MKDKNFINSALSVIEIESKAVMNLRNQIQSDMVLLDQELTQLKTKVSKLKNRTHRLSDDFLDFDLLDTQARFILGFIKPREIIIN